MSFGTRTQRPTTFGELAEWLDQRWRNNFKPSENNEDLFEGLSDSETEDRDDTVTEKRLNLNRIRKHIKSNNIHPFFKDPESNSA